MMWSLMQKKNIAISNESENSGDNQQEEQPAEENKDGDPTIPQQPVEGSNNKNNLFAKINDMNLNKFLLYFPLFKY